MFIQPVGNTVLLKRYPKEVTKKKKSKKIESDKIELRDFVHQVVRVGEGNYNFIGKLLKKIGIYSKDDIASQLKLKKGDIVTLQMHAGGNAMPNLEDINDPYFIVESKSIMTIITI